MFSNPKTWATTSVDAFFFQLFTCCLSVSHLIARPGEFKVPLVVLKAYGFVGLFCVCVFWVFFFVVFFCLLVFFCCVGDVIFEYVSSLCSCFKQCLVSCVCTARWLLSGWLAIHLVLQKLKHWTAHTDFATNSSIPYCFIPLSVTLTLADKGGGSLQHQLKAKIVDFSFLHILIMMNFSVMMKQYKPNILILILSEIFLSTGKNCCLFCQ